MYYSVFVLMMSFIHYAENIKLPKPLGMKRVAHLSFATGLNML